jgi:hypothetical protein
MVDASDDATGAGGDVLPGELDVTALVGPYLFPDIRRRRLAAGLYALVAAASLAAGASSGNGGLVAAGVVLVLVALYVLACAWPLRVDQTEALTVASREVGFPVGHASARLAWRGLRSRPAWQVLVYSADEPPSIRGLVELDANDGRVLGSYTESNPEDWGTPDDRSAVRDAAGD